uniref:Uncharacterized protein n=1 Tax=Anguilla anguilla TaxID=7936 RepID=A0A0E9W897_ANGAN
MICQLGCDSVMAFAANNAIARYTDNGQCVSLAAIV